MFESFVLLSAPDRDLRRGQGCLLPQKAVHVREWNIGEVSAYLKSRDFAILDHKLVPPLRFNWSREYLMQWYSQFRAGRPFNSCQMVVCKQA